MRYGSLFSGVGGLDLGLDRAGWQCAFQCEIDPFCRQVLAKHWPQVKRYGDITKLRGADLPRVDLLAGGFPCQDLSQAGRRAGIEAPRSGLWFEFARIVGELRPRYVLIENVPGLLVHDAMRRVVGELARLRYVGTWFCFRASEFGASHLRKRVFIVAYRSGAGFRQHDDHSELPERVQYELGQCSDDVADAERAERRPHDEHEQLRAERREEADRLGSGGGIVDDAAGARLGGRRSGEGEAARDAARLREPGGRRDALAHAAGCNGQLAAGIGARPGEAEGAGPQRDDPGSGVLLGAFAPGPSDPRWPRILAERPDLAPALPQVRGVAPRISPELELAMMHRTKRLSRLGNSVVPQCAQWIGERLLEFAREEAWHSSKH